MDLASVVDAYWEHYRLAESGLRSDRLRAEDVFWACEAVDSLMVGDHCVEAPLGCNRVGLLVALADRAPDTLAYLGAGPVENLLTCGEPDIDMIVAAAKGNENFRTALRCAWFDQRLPAADASRLRQFGPPL